MCLTAAIKKKKIYKKPNQRKKSKSRVRLYYFEFNYVKMHLKNQAPVTSLFLSPGLFVFFVCLLLNNVSRHKKISDTTSVKSLWLVHILCMH